jgi:flavin-dependent dehydrogenase
MKGEDFNPDFDIIITGGGPVGSTVATLLRKYMPRLRVLIVEKCHFPRDHVGESQLPSISPILHEMGVWDKIEAEEFPIKIGASYTWGANQEKWDFDFYPIEKWVDEPRPAKFEGQRAFTAFQVDRARYDEILLRHAESLGTEVREGVKVDQVLVDGDRIDGLRLSTGDVVTGKYYIDGSGVSGLLRRAMGVQSDAPQALRNIAIWDYWENAEWAVEIGVGATRVQVRSLSYGWIWFIPLGPTRTSIGLICPSEYYKKSGKTPEQLYREALSEQPEIAQLTRNATPDDNIQTCKDWSHLSERLVGENWFLCGESAGFADPILAAGMSLAHSSAREVAYTIIELEHGDIDSTWLRNRYDERNRTNIGQHIRFAQYWYAANGCFTDLQDECRAIAKEAGLNLAPNQAWRWLSQGGFTTEQLELATLGSFDLFSAKQVLERFDVEERKCAMLADGCNVFKLNLSNAKNDQIGMLRDGRIHMLECYRKGKKTLPLSGFYGTMVQVLKQSSDAATILGALQQKIAADLPPTKRDYAYSACIQALDVMIQEGWVKSSRNKKKPVVRIDLGQSRHLRSSAQAQEALERAGRAAIIRSNV